MGYRLWGIEGVVQAGAGGPLKSWRVTHSLPLRVLPLAKGESFLSTSFVAVACLRHAVLVVQAGRLRTIENVAETCKNVLKC